MLSCRITSVVRGIRWLACCLFTVYCIRLAFNFSGILQVVPFFKPIITKIDSIHSNTLSMQTTQTTQHADPCDAHNANNATNATNATNSTRWRIWFWKRWWLILWLHWLRHRVQWRTTQHPAKVVPHHQCTHHKHFITLTTSHMRDIHIFIQMHRFENNGGGHVTNLSHLPHACTPSCAGRSPLYTTSCTHS